MTDRTENYPLLQEDSLDGPIKDRIGEEIYRLAGELFPLCRSITGNGVRDTLRRITAHIPLRVHDIATGTQVFDWTIPREWSIREAYVRDGSGRKIIDFAANNLHLLNYSIPVRKKVSLDELKRHLYTLPSQPDLIPYRTSYYAENWGFCISHRQLESLGDDEYEVVIDSELSEGSMTYAEYVHRGTSDDEVLISTHICHPSLANDNCSGLALTTFLAKQLQSMKTRYTYRFLFAPGTIGAIAWLARNEESTARIKHGLVVSGVGDGGGPTYKRTRRGDTEIDRTMVHVLKHSAPQSSILDFSPYGYDERQYCSPGFNLPVGMFQRSQFDRYPEYHTSADNLDFIRPKHLHESYTIIATALAVLEGNDRYRNALPKCEPQLGKRGLYSAIGNQKDSGTDKMAMLWVLNLSDGQHTLLDIAERADLPFNKIRASAELLLKHQLLQAINTSASDRS
jgi:aminopeptidase-like protein